MNGMYQYPYYSDFHMNNRNVVYNPYGVPYCPYFLNSPAYSSDFRRWNGYIPDYVQTGNPVTELKDYGPEPFVINIERAAVQNNNYRTALWTGKHLQVTLMSIGVGEDIGLEVHPDVDQFIRVEEGQGLVEMGDSRNNLDYRRRVYEDYVIIIPAGKWHNVINTGNRPMKLYSLYAPPQHPHGTVHETREIAEAAEEHN